MLANLYRIYSNLDPVDDSDVRDEILDSLEKRWAAADQEPFIATVILNRVCLEWNQKPVFRPHLWITIIGAKNFLQKPWLWWTG